jgi:hypothetical protein
VSCEIYQPTLNDAQNALLASYGRKDPRALEPKGSGNKSTTDGHESK